MTAATLHPHFVTWPQRLPRQMVLPETSLWFNLEVSARRYPAQAACGFLGRNLSLADLLAQAEALAGWLQAHGVAQGDRVAVFTQNCPQFVIAVHAVLRADAVVVPVNPMNLADEFGHYITDCRRNAAAGCPAVAAGRPRAAGSGGGCGAGHPLDRPPGRRPPAGRAHRRARQLGAAALHQRHHGPAQGLHAHAPHAEAQRDVRRDLGFQRA